MIRRVLVAGMVLGMFALSLGQVNTSHAVQPINFTRGTLTGAGFTTANPTTLEIGPDGRLYVADGSGRIQALTMSAGTSITAVQQLTTATQLQEVYGIAFDPNDATSPPPVWVTNTISGFGDAGQAPAGAYSGKVTKISGPTYGTLTDFITGLPVSNSGHQANGLAFGPDGNLYIGQGSTTNKGVINPAGGLFQRDEVPTSGAILVADVTDPGFDGDIVYSPPGVYSTTVDQVSGDVTVYAYGLRNPYDIVFHSNGKLYNTDNGPNAGYGPGSETCSTDDGSESDAPDELNIIEAGKYYGHPNRNRAFEIQDTLLCDYKGGGEATSGNYRAPIGLLPPSSDGLDEYKYGGFGGQMQGDLVYVSWVDNTLHRVKLSGDGSAVIFDVTLATGLTNALDVAVAPDGTIYVAEWGSSRITYFKPDESAANDITVTGIFPAGGPEIGGQPVTISGTNFTTTAETFADIGGASITSLVVQNSTTITGVTSGNSTGPKSLTVTNSIGSDTKPNAYTYSSGGSPLPPVADAGEDWSGPIAHNDHAHVTLDGQASSDPDGFIATYEWSEGGNVLSTNSIDSVQFTLGEHFVTLTVTDGASPVPNSDTDVVRIVVTQFAENPDPYYCSDVNGDTAVNIIDLLLIAQSSGQNYGMPGYTRLKDWNATRSINVIDLMGTAQDFTTECPLVDQQLRAAVVGSERFMNINQAIAEGYVQVTPYIPGQGRHMVKGTVAGQDTVFDPALPESLLYEPDGAGGWRLGGLMYIMPIDLVPLPPPGFAGNEDAWHYHDALCLWNNFASVQENVTQADCLSRPGNPVWIDKAGWLVHIWLYVPNYQGRFVEVNTAF